MKAENDSLCKFSAEILISAGFSLNPPEQMRLMLARKVMLPNAENLPVGPPQGSGHQPVAGDVTGKLATPERRVALGFGSMLGTTMPETTIHEDCQLELGENKIRADTKGFL